jgi:hypothetical protein
MAINSKLLCLLDDSNLYINELNIVVFVQDLTSKLILQGIEIPIRNGYKKD